MDTYVFEKGAITPIGIFCLYCLGARSSQVNHESIRVVDSCGTPGFKHTSWLFYSSSAPHYDDDFELNFVNVHSGGAVKRSSGFFWDRIPEELKNVYEYMHGVAKSGKSRYGDLNYIIQVILDEETDDFEKIKKGLETVESAVATGIDPKGPIDIQTVA